MEDNDQGQPEWCRKHTNVYTCLYIHMSISMTAYMTRASPSGTEHAYIYSRRCLFYVCCVSTQPCLPISSPTTCRSVAPRSLARSCVCSFLRSAPMAIDNGSGLIGCAAGRRSRRSRTPRSSKSTAPKPKRFVCLFVCSRAHVPANERLRVNLLTGSGLHWISRRTGRCSRCTRARGAMRRTRRCRRTSTCGTSRRSTGSRRRVRDPQ